MLGLLFAGVLNFNEKGACELRNRNLRNLNVVQLNLTKTDEIEKAVGIVSEQCSATSEFKITILYSISKLR